MVIFLEKNTSLCFNFTGTRKNTKTGGNSLRANKQEDV